MSQELTDKSSGTVIPVRMFPDYTNGSIHFSFYIPEVEKPLDQCLKIISDPESLKKLEKSSQAATLIGGFPEQTMSIPSSTLIFGGHIYIYSENDLSTEEIAILNSESERRGYVTQFYGKTWLEQRSSLEKPLAFISHDARDKDAIARPLAEELRKIPGCIVWFDEYSLKVGDSLRTSIEKGIKECKKCILVLTPNYFDNNGWAAEEFSAVFTRERIEQERVILPVWHNVTKQDVYNYSPSLADTVAIRWDSNVQAIASQIYRATIT